MASPCLGKAAPHYESEEDTATAPHPREATTEAAERQLPEHRGGVEQCHRSLGHGPVQGQGPVLSSVL